MSDNGTEVRKRTFANLDPETTVGFESSGADVDPPRQRRLQIGARPLLAMLVLLLLLSTGAAVTFGLLFTEKQAVDDASNQAVSTARSYAVTVTTYDFNNLDKNFADVLDGATGEFKDQYSGASSALKQLIQQAQATAKGTVLDAGVVSASKDQVQVLVMVDQQVTNSAAKEPRLDRTRMLLTLERHDDRWLVGKLELK